MHVVVAVWWLKGEAQKIERLMEVAHVFLFSVFCQCYAEFLQYKSPTMVKYATILFVE